MDCAVARRALEGEPVSGDRHALIAYPGGLLVAVVDGLGHGRDAAIAAECAVAALLDHPERSVHWQVEQCHRALAKTRGAVMALASIDARRNSAQWTSVGNVEALLLKPNALGKPSRDTIPTRGGIIGHRLPPLRIESLAVEPGDVFVFATDGIQGGFADRLNLSSPPRELADRILGDYGKATDDALVLVGRWLGADAGA